MKSRNRRRRSGGILISIGIVLILAALFLTLYNFYESYEAGEKAQGIVAELKEDIEDTESDSEAETNEHKQYDEMPIKKINGYDYIGTIQIPSLNMELPVMDDWDYNRLNISPCRYYGSYLTDDMVLCGHNYSTHFGPLRDIEIGKDVYFINVDGEVYRYTVECVDILNPFDVRDMTHNDWDLSLFTCTSSGQTRCTVRCKKAEE